MIQRSTILDEINNICSHFCRIYILVLACLYIRPALPFLFHQKGTVVEKLTEETLRDKGHLLELLAVCEGIYGKLNFVFFSFLFARKKKPPTSIGLCFF